MAKAKVELNCVGEIASSTEGADEYVPANGATVEIKKFAGTAAFSVNSVVRLVWDYGGAAEEIVWTIKGEGKMPFDYEVIGDGTKKLAVVCENAEAGGIYMSGYALLLVRP